MKVILLERVGRLGGIGSEVTVKDGFARNYLLPEGRALRATDANRARFEVEKVEIEKRNDERRQEAAGVAAGLNGHQLIMIRQAGETGQLYGSVSSRDIVDGLARDGFSVQRRQVDLAMPIKTVGMHSVALQLHAEVDVNVSINVARSEDEALRQAKGEDMTVVSYDDDEPAAEAVSPEEVFDEVPEEITDESGFRDWRSEVEHEGDRHLEGERLSIL